MSSDSSESAAVDQAIGVTDHKRPIEQAVELGLYAPIGFLMDAKKMLPDLVERGRQQVNMAKVVGQMVVTHGQNSAAARVARVQDQTEAIFQEFGIGVKPPVVEPQPASDPVAQPGEAHDKPVAAPKLQSSSEVAAELPIAAYDSLAASQVIPRLSGLSEAEIDAVEAYELAHRGRKTILGKIAQLRAE